MVRTAFERLWFWTEENVLLVQQCLGSIVLKTGQHRRKHQDYSTDLRQLAQVPAAQGVSRQRGVMD